MAIRGSGAGCQPARRLPIGATARVNNPPQDDILPHILKLTRYPIRIVCIMALSLLLAACTSVHAPVTLTFVDQGWATPKFNQERERVLLQFTGETGIQVKLLPSPESTREQLALWRELLGTGASGPDVYTMDVIWPGILNEYFIDLKPYFAGELSQQFPAIVASFT